MLIREFTDYSPHVLLFGMLATFVVLGFLQYGFYLEVFNNALVAGLIASIIQVLRFAAGLTSANFFKNHRWFLGVVVITLSVWLTYFEHGEVMHISGTITTSHPEATVSVLRVLVWVGPILELFLGLTLGVISGRPASRSSSASPNGKASTDVVQFDIAGNLNGQH